jgi:hypothetical protein
MLKRLPVKKLDGEELFKHTGDKYFSVVEFWRYGFSNLNSNVLRGALAEFLIENAIRDKTQIDVRNPWGDSDVVTDDGLKIEVKCCSYIQDWDQNDFSYIQWTGLKAKKLYWNEAVGSHDKSEADYKSDIYILCLFKHKEAETLDILDLDQWCFWVLSKERLKEVSKNANSVSLKRLEKVGIEPIGFGQINEAIKTYEKEN